MTTNRWKKFILIAGLGFACLTFQNAHAADPALTFDKVVEYLDLEVKEERILKLVNESVTQFTLGADQLKLLKSKGASDALIEAMQKKSSSPKQLAAGASDISDFVLILDCSGSMKDVTGDGKTKWDVAQQAALDLIAAIPNGRQLAFIAYGHNKELACQSVEVIRPLSPLSDKSRAALSGLVKQLQPVGNTPIALSLEKAAEELESASGMSKIVLITDGIETCMGDPVATAKKLAANQKLKGGVNVIGFGLKDEESAAVSAIAKSGNGEYYDAKNAADLVRTVKAVERTLTQARPKSIAVKSDVKPSKELTAPATIEVGKYVAGRLGSDQSHYFAIDLSEGEYVAVCDVKRANDLSGTLIFNVKTGGDGLCGMSANELLNRAAGKFRSNGGTRTFTLENSRFSGIVDYHFAVYRVDDRLPFPFIEFGTAEIQNLDMGKSVSMKLDPPDFSTRDAYYRVKLEPGDYAVTVTFRAPTATSDYGVGLETMNPLGVRLDNIGSEFGRARNKNPLTIKSKLILADDMSVIFRVRGWGAPIECDFSVTPWKAVEPK